MRHHDIERLKEAARRYAANKYTVGDLKELSEFACNALFEPPIRKVDNGDGTETWYGLPVVVPVGLIPDDETPVEVRSRDVIPATGSVRAIKYNGEVGDVQQSSHALGDLRIMLAAKPQPITWRPPASLPNGEYLWNGESIEPASRVWSANKYLTLPSLFRDWTDPPRLGRYKVENGTATWIGE